MGKDSYMVGTSAMGGFRSKTEITQESIARANAYCEAMGKEMMSHTQDSGVRGWASLESEIQFKCLNKSTLNINASICGKIPIR